MYNLALYQPFHPDVLWGSIDRIPPKESNVDGLLISVSHVTLGGNGDVYDFMLFFNPYIEIILQEIKTFKEKHKIIDVPYYTIMERIFQKINRFFYGKWHIAVLDLERGLWTSEPDIRYIFHISRLKMPMVVTFLYSL